MRRDFPVSNAGLASAFEFISEFIKSVELDEGLVHRLSVVLDELCANMIRHDETLNSDTSFEIGMSLVDRIIQMEISDPGQPFNPLEFRHAERPEIGGHGIDLVKGLSSSVSYSREADRNVMRISIDSED